MEHTWPESLGWVMFGLTIYFSYGITHSNAANEDKNSHFEPHIATSNRTLHENENTNGTKSECLLLSKRRNEFRPSNNTEPTFDRVIPEDQNYQENASTNIIKNYNPRSNNLLTSVNQDIPLDEPSHFSLEPHI